MRWIKKAFFFLSCFVILLLIGVNISFAAYNVPPPPGGSVPPTYTSGGYSPAVMYSTYCPGGECIPGWNTGGNWQGAGTYAGFYQAPNGNYYPIGVGNVVVGNNGGGGGGPEDPGTGVCTGVYGSCSAWSTCSLKCGGGTQIQYCFDTGCGNVQENTQSCNTQTCGPWTKLKDSSYVSTNSLYNLLSLTPVAYDADDTTDQYFIVGNDGVVAAPGIELDISNVTPTAKTGNPEYKVIYTPESYSLTPSSFLSYVRARKEYKVITDLGEITGSGIYVYSGDLAISSNVTPFNQSYKIVLIVSGTVTISAAPDNTFTPSGTAAIVATTINFDSTITEAHGVFIGRTISTGTNANQGLKIVGNLIAQTTLSNNREWPTTTKPSVFIKFDQAKYINLLPYLSTASYQWRQIQ